MKEVAFGQYYPIESFVHRLDARFKLIFLIVYIVAIFVADSFWGLGVLALVLAAAVILARIPVGKVLRAVRGIVVLVLFTAVINIFFYRGTGDPLVAWGIIAIYREGILFSAFLILRLVLLVICSSLLTYTTTPVSLTDGIESLLTPLKWIRFPVHELALIMSIALRFIPILMDETERIKNAQKARGADFESGSIVSRVKAMIPILIPLLLSAFRRADELGEAMDARCYAGSKHRTKYKKLVFTWRDGISALVLAGMLASVIVLRIFVGGVI